MFEKNSKDLATDLFNKADELLEANRLEEAIPYYQRAIEIDPNLPLAWLNCGVALLEVGEYKIAKSYLRKAIQIAPPLREQVVAIFISRGIQIKEQGYLTYAIDYLEFGLEIVPDHLLEKLLIVFRIEKEEQ
ncbi:MAG: tetratricopeptide repeat protein [Bacillota bacterium]|nr:tetratricopeptide repeat protein [Bacillota bacterium]MDW7685016.1 tetratricopeptide repeat protein [Bacillota bacterium]